MKTRARSDHSRVGQAMNSDSSPNPDTAPLSDLGQVTSLSWASVFSFFTQSYLSGYCLKVYNVSLC